MRQTHPTARRAKPVPLPVIHKDKVKVVDLTVKVIRIGPKDVTVVYK